MDWLKWVVVLILGFFVFAWLRNGINASAQLSPNGLPGANGGGLYAPGSSWASFFSPFSPGPWAYGARTPIAVDYSPSNDNISFRYGF